MQLKTILFDEVFRFICNLTNLNKMIDYQTWCESKRACEKCQTDRCPAISCSADSQAMGNTARQALT